MRVNPLANTGSFKDSLQGFSYIVIRHVSSPCAFGNIAEEGDIEIVSVGMRVKPCPQVLDRITSYLDLPCAALPLVWHYKKGTAPQEPKVGADVIFGSTLNSNSSTCII